MPTDASQETGTQIAVDAVAPSVLRLDRALFDLFPDTSFVLKDGKIVLINPAAVRLLGGETAQAMIGREGLDLLVPEDRDRMLAHRARSLAVSGPVPFDGIRMVKADGSIFLVEGKTVRCEVDGEPSLLVVVQDVTDRVRSQRAFEHRGSQLANAQRIAKLTFFEWEISADKILWADEANAVLGFPVSGLCETSQALVARVSGPDRDRVRLAIERVVDDGSPLTAEFRLDLADGEFVVLEVQGEVELDSDRRPDSVFGICRNVTDQYEAATALHESERRFQYMIDALPESIRVQVDNRIVYANAAAVRLLGASSLEHLLGVDRSAFFFGDDEAEALAKRVPLEIGETRSWHEQRRRRLDGAVIDLESARMGISWEGAPAELVISRDISGRKRAEAAHKESESRLRSIIANVPGMVYERVLHPDGKITFTFMNDASLDISGISSEEIVRNPRAMFTQIHDDDRDEWLESIRRSAETLEPVSRDFRIHHRKLGLRWLHATSRPRAGANGEVIWDSLILDMTEQKLIAQDLERHAAELAASKAEAERARDEAEHASQSKSDFLANMSHEIRTPMNGVLGMINVLLQSELSADQRLQAETIKTSGEELLSLLNDILDLSKVEAGKMEVEAIDFRIDDVLRGVRDLWEPRVRAKGVDFEIHIRDAPLPVLRSDPGRIRQILFNLVSNAAKFTESGRIAVELRRAPGADGKIAIRCDVTDTGIGITQKAQRDLFSSFTQADSSMTRRFGGSGLGLAICRRMVELLGGEIHVESTPGKGSRFWFVIQCEHGDPEALVAQDQRTSRPDGEPGEQRILRILVAEDNHINQTIIRLMLSRAGHTVDTVANGVEAVGALMRAPYDLVLMDVQMPEMDGVTATRKIRALDGPASTIPIIAVTANAMKGDRERYLEAGMTDYLSKPIDLRTLNGKIAEAMSAPTKTARPQAGPARRPAAAPRKPKQEPEHGTAEALDALIETIDRATSGGGS